MGIEPRNDCKIFISGFPPFQDSLTTLVSSVKYFGKDDAHRAWDVNCVGCSQEPLGVAPSALPCFISPSVPAPGMASGSCW